MDRAPRLRAERPRQEPEPALRPQACRGGGRESFREIERAHQDRRAAQHPAGARAGRPALAASRRSWSRTTAPRSIGAAYARIASSYGSCSSRGSPSATATTRRRPRRPVRSRSTAGPRSTECARRGRRRSRPRPNRPAREGEGIRALLTHAVVEAAPDPHQPGPLPRRQLEGLGLAQEPDDDVVPSQFDRVLGRSQQPLGPRRRIVAEPGGALQRRRRPRSRPAVRLASPRPLARTRCPRRARRRPRDARSGGRRGRTRSTSANAVCTRTRRRRSSSDGSPSA